MKHLVISASLHPGSRSRILGRAAFDRLDAAGAEVAWLDLAEQGLPFCDGATAYGDPAAVAAKERVEAADGILLAAPVYNYDVNAVAKNLVELTGRAWSDKVVGILCAAGGQSSYMSVMGIANSLMLDFRSVVIPRFVYATGAAFEGDAISDGEVRERVEQLSDELLRFTAALRG